MSALAIALRNVRYDPKQTLADLHVTHLRETLVVFTCCWPSLTTLILPKIGSRKQFLRGRSPRAWFAGRHSMKNIVVAAVIGIWCVPSATLAGERVGDAALGALSGAVVLGPVGAVAGAVIGYTAGPSIADSWGLRRSEPRQSAKLPPKTTPKRVSSTQVNPPADPRRDTSARDVPTPLVKPSTHSDDAKQPINGLQM